MKNGVPLTMATDGVDELTVSKREKDDGQKEKKHRKLTGLVISADDISEELKIPVETFA